MIVLVAVNTVGSANNAILNAVMEHMFSMTSASNVRVCVKTTRLVTNQQGTVIMVVIIIGLENIAMYAVMEHTFREESVSIVKGYVKTTHLVTSQPEHVIMDVVIIGQENFVKNVLMGFTTRIAVAFVVFV